MKTVISIVVALLLASVARSAPTSQPASDDIPYTPEPDDAQQSRFGGGARAAGEGPTIFLLISQRPSKTIRENSTVYWFLTGDTSADLDVVISRPDKTMPLIKRTITGDKKAGIGSIELKDAKLEIGVQYKVTVFLWADRGAARGSNPFSSGFITHIDRPASLADAGPDPDQMAFAKVGLWYDSLDAVSKRIAKTPDDKTLRRQRLGLLRKEHVFLSFAAPEDQKNAPGVEKAAQEAAKAEQDLLSQLSKLEGIE